MFSSLPWRRIFAGLLPLLAVACVEVPEKDAPVPTPILLVLDSASSTVPAPSDFLLTVDPASQTHDADRAFFAYLQSLGGLTPTQTIAIPADVPEGATFSDPPDTSVVVLPLGADPAPGHSVSWSEATSSVVVSFDAPTPLGSRYAVAVLGNGAAGGLTGESPERMVSEPVAIFFSKAKSPLVDFAAPDTCAAPTPEGIVHINNPVLFAQLGGVVERAKAGAEVDPAELAEALASLCLLEGLRLQYEPLWAAVEGAGLSRSDVIMLFTVTTGDATFAELNSDTGRIPTPNDLALTQDLSSLPDSADKDFFTYLINDLGGFPHTNGVSVPFTGPVRESSLNRGLLFTGTVSPSAQNIAFDTDSNTASVTLDTVIPPGNTLVGIVTRDVVDEAGNPVAPPAEFVFMTSTDPLVSTSPCDPETLTPGDVTSTVLRGQLASGGVAPGDICLLENARAGFAPIFDNLALQGIERSDLAIAFSATFPDRTYATFDPAGGVIGFPNDFLRDQETGLVNLPVSENDSPTIQAIIGGLNMQDGFSTTAPSYSLLKYGELGTTDLKPLIHWGAVEVNPEDTSDVAVLDDKDLNVYYESYDPANESDGHIWVQPKRPLGQDKIIVVALFDTLVDENDAKLAPDSAFVFLRTAHPLVDENGNSLVAALDDGTAAALEVARGALVTVFDTLETGAFSLLTGGKKRNNIVQVYVYKTQTVTTPLQSLRAATYPIAQAASISDAAFSSPGTPVDPTTLPDLQLRNDDFKDHIGCVIPDAELSSINFLNDAVGTGTFGVDGNGDPTFTLDTLGVTILAPNVSTGGACEGQTDFPVIIAQHGFGGHRRGFAFDIASTFNEACYIVVAIDVPEHGGRDPDASSIHPDEFEFGSLKAQDLHAENFLSLNLFATRDSVRQATLDQVQLVRAIRGGALSAALDNAACGNISANGDDISYVGLSLGGILGNALMAVEPGVQNAVLSAAGGPFSTLVLDSEWEVLQNTAANVAALGGTELGSAAFDELIHIVQWVLDPADPVNYATHFGANPLDDLITGNPGPAKHVLIQKVTGDGTVPNSSTDALIRAADWGDDGSNNRSYQAALVETLADGLDHSVIATGALRPETERIEATLCAQIQALDFIENARASDGSAPPALSTDSRADSCRAPAAP